MVNYVVSELDRHDFFILHASVMAQNVIKSPINGMLNLELTLRKWCVAHCFGALECSLFSLLICSPTRYYLA